MKVNQTMSILFWIFKAKTGSDGKAPIYCRITIEGTRAEFSTRKRIEANNWETKPGIAKGKNEDVMHINKELTKIKSDLQRSYDGLEGISELNFVSFCEV